MSSRGHARTHRQYLRAELVPALNDAADPNMCKRAPDVGEYFDDLHFPLTVAARTPADPRKSRDGPTGPKVTNAAESRAVLVLPNTTRCACLTLMPSVSERSHPLPVGDRFQHP